LLQPRRGRTATNANALPPPPPPPPRFHFHRPADRKLPTPPRCRLSARHAAAKLPPPPPAAAASLALPPPPPVVGSTSSSLVRRIEGTIQQPTNKEKGENMAPISFIEIIYIY
jgi:hypothetical protein